MGLNQKLNTQPASLSPLVQLAGIRKSFDGKTVISDLDLTINNGEFLTLLGPSGCGKTTVLRLIAGLDNVDHGHIHLEDQDITQVPAEHRHVNTVFQSYALFPHMTVFENVAFGLRMQKTPASEITPRVTEALRMVQLETFAQRKPHQLSGGQQQRVAIARAVVNKPRLLLLDESLSALDYKLRKQMQNELKALQRKLGITFVFVTHDQEEALTMSDRIVVMRDGKIEQDGTPREIYEEPKNLFVASFIGEINIFSATVIERLDDQRVLANVEGRACNIFVNFAVEPGQQLNVLLRPEDLRVDEIHDETEVEGLIGYIRERNYKGMTLESVVELENGKMVIVSEFFNEDDPDFDHSLNQKMVINWVEAGRLCWLMKNTSKFQNVVIATIVGWLVLFVFLPNLMIIATSFLTRDDAHFVSLVFTLENYARLLDPLYFQVLLHSLNMALIATLACLVLGYPFAWFLAKLPQKVRPLLLFLLIVPFWTNSLIRIYGLKIFLSTKGYLNAFLLWLGVIDTPIRIMFTPGAVIIGLVYILLPFMVMPLYSSIEKLDKPLLEAARDLGASKLQTFIRIIIPLTMPGIIAGCLLVMLPAMGLFYVSDLMGGAKNLLIGNVIKSQFLNIRDWPFGSATSITLTVVMGLMLLVYWRASRLLNNKGELG